MKETHSMMLQAVDVSVVDPKSVNHVTVSDWSYQLNLLWRLADKGSTVHFLSPRLCCEVLLFLLLFLLLI